MSSSASDRYSLAIIDQDPYLEPHRGEIQRRLLYTVSILQSIASEWRMWYNRQDSERCEDIPDVSALSIDDLDVDTLLRCIRRRCSGTMNPSRNDESLHENVLDCLVAFSEGHRMMGFQENASGDPILREWAPNAVSLHLIGDFNDWSLEKAAATQISDKDERTGIWTVSFADNLEENDCRPIMHSSSVKVAMRTKSAPAEVVYRIPAYAPRAEPRPKTSNTYTGVYWKPSIQYQWKHPRQSIGNRNLIIYEAHVGMSSEFPEIATYLYFARSVIPYIAKCGYTCIQIMGIMEHPYYASFGYHVTSFFAASSRFGTPEDLKYLVDTAHSYGLVVILDCVHAHASSNTEDGLNNFDSPTGAPYFHEGTHPQWDSKMFRYHEPGVLQFLLSNLRYWIEEFRFDGYRFDGVTSMLYNHHGNGVCFQSYDDYFHRDVGDHSAISYLQTAMLLLHMLYTDVPVLTIAEDVSGYPGLCRPVHEGGIGFDYRLAMSVPDLWIKLLKERPDKDWNIGHIVWELNNRRFGEKCIAYAESHDQALVGDKTILMWLLNEEIYTNMSVLAEETPRVSRGIALHKMIRAITMFTGGDAYLNFMGNEFGHPEWIDFPREGNGDSFQHCRRQWPLTKDKLLRYQHLLAWDNAMIGLANQLQIFEASGRRLIAGTHEDDKIAVVDVERWNAESDQWQCVCVCVYNFHYEKSFADYRIGVSSPGTYTNVLDTDQKRFGGYDRVTPKGRYFSQSEQWMSRAESIMIYIPSRTAIFLVPEESATNTDCMQL